MVSQTLIARQLSISQKTVSRCVTAPQTVNPQTLARVQSLFRELGYEPNALSSGLKNQRLTVLGICVPVLQHWYFPALVEAVEREARRNGWQTMISASHNDEALQADQLSMMRRLRLGGMIVVPYRQNLDIYKWMLFRRASLVFADIRPDLDVDYAYVGTNGVLGGRLATEHLLGLRHRRIAIMSASLDTSSLRDRYEGYRLAMAVTGAAVDPRWVLKGGFNVEDGRRAFRQLEEFPTDARPTAVFCDNDAAAAGVILEALAQGKRVPDDLSVVGFSGADWCELLPVELTTVAQPATDVGVTAVQLLLEQVTEGAEPRRVELDPTLVVRKSTGAAPNP